MRRMQKEIHGQLSAPLPSVVGETQRPRMPRLPNRGSSMKRCEEAKQWRWVATLLYNAFENPDETSDELQRQAIRLYEKYDSPQEGDDTE
jgi:hypothetical protein